MFVCYCCVSFICALYNSLRTNIYPGACGHLAVHHQSFLFELIKMLPVGVAYLMGSYLGFMIVLMLNVFYFTQRRKGNAKNTGRPFVFNLASLRETLTKVVNL